MADFIKPPPPGSMGWAGRERQPSEKWKVEKNIAKLESRKCRKEERTTITLTLPSPLIEGEGKERRTT